MARPRVADERREAILAAFEGCVLRNGFDRTTLDDIAREAAQPRSLVRYFAGNRADLVSLLIDRILERTERHLAALRATPGDDGRARLVDFVFSELFGDPVSTRLVGELWHLSAHSEPVRERLSALYRHVVDDMSGQVAPAMPGVSDSARHDAVLALFGLGLGLTVLRQLGLEPRDDLQVAALARSLVAPPPSARPARRNRSS